MNEHVVVGSVEYDRPINPQTTDEWADYINEWCTRKGWNDNPKFPEMLLNLHSEVSEAWEEYRNNRGVSEIYYNDSKPEKPEGIPIEITDLLIRVLHLMKYLGWDVNQLLNLKMAFNEKREYRHGGKKA